MNDGIKKKLLVDKTAKESMCNWVYMYVVPMVTSNALNMNQNG